MMDIDELQEAFEEMKTQANSQFQEQSDAL